MRRAGKLAGEVQVEEGKRQVEGKVVGVERYCWGGWWCYWPNQEQHSGCCCSDPANTQVHVSCHICSSPALGVLCM